MRYPLQTRRHLTPYVRQKFGDVEAEKMYLGRKNAVRLSVVYYPEIHTYRGEKNIQIVVKNYR